MIAIDLQSALFAVLVCVVCGVASVGYLWYRWRQRVVMESHLYAMPFGVVVLTPSGHVVEINTTAHRILESPDLSTEHVLSELLGLLPPPTSEQQSGTLGQPRPLRW